MMFAKRLAQIYFETASFLLVYILENDKKICESAVNISLDETTLASLKMAIRNKTVQNGLIFHSDRGVQYANNKFVNALASYKVIQSMSRTGNCWIMQ